MTTDKIFVGRKDELEQFKKVLAEPQGQAVLVVGQAGMGKTWLINKMAGIAENHPELKCGWVRYEVTPTDSVDSTMALMMDNAFEAGQVREGSFDGTARALEQWRCLLNVIKVGDLLKSLRRDPQQNTREQFLKRLELISGRMKKSQRVIFIIDPEKYMQEKSDQSWAIIVRSLPEKIKLVFAQRPEDELVKGNVFNGLENIVYIPEKRLGILDESNVGELVRLRAEEVGQQELVLRKAVQQYEGHPYAVQAALDLIKERKRVKGLPKDPTPEAIAEAQWGRVCERGDEAIELFEAYAILEVAVPDDIVEAVNGLNTTARKRLQRDGYLRGLLREEEEGMRIYHAILADCILGQIGEEEKQKYHGRAVDVYREKLRKAKKEQTRPDGLAAVRLAEHVLAAEGEKAFVYAVLNESGKLLKNLGLLDAVENLLLRALEVVEKGSEDEAMVLGNLGLIYQTRGELDKAEQMQRRALEIDEKLGLQKGMAEDYGNLGAIYLTQGELDKAEEMFRDGLKIEERLGLLEGMATKYGNLGVIYMDRGELDKAEQMYLKALEIDEKIGHLEGVARHLGNLGIIYDKRGELDKAEEMHKKSLEISEKIGLQEAMASQYGNLGVVYERRGDIKKTLEYRGKAVDLYKRIGMPHMVKKMQGWIDELRGGRRSV